MRWEVGGEEWEDCRVRELHNTQPVTLTVRTPEGRSSEPGGCSLSWVLSSGVAGKYGNPQRHWSPVKLKSAPNVKIPSYTGRNWVKHFIFENGVIPSLTVFVPPISVLFMWVSYNVHLLYTYCTHSTLDDVQRVGGGKNLYKKCIELYKPLW